MIYGLGTGLPVLIFAVLVSTGVEYLNKAYHIVTKIEFYTKKFTGVIFTPAVIVDGKIMLSGKLPSVEELKKLFSEIKVKYG
jgi:predicted thioredoxin/glutaredoxin